IIKRHHAWIEKFYPANAETYKGLGKTYTENPEFREYYDKYKTGLAEFLCTAMEHFANKQLK
ncbi:MAG: TipAS antibiotic-recognition domain-containing protein, partial [Deltaproteobacteria bacterium]|nr:TipAS antibiotic-recognition domain-containing protein [Deltaproteobacteria bacterium]